MNYNEFILLEGAPQEAPGWMSLLPWVAIILVFYFFMIRPQTKKAKEQKKFRESLDTGAKVVTIGGLHGKIVGMQDTTVLLEVESGTKIKVEKSAISMDSSSMLSEQK
jgi:preprotein translocase subunit YajC